MLVHAVSKCNKTYLKAKLKESQQRTSDEDGMISILPKGRRNHSTYRRRSLQEIEKQYEKTHIIQTGMLDIDDNGNLFVLEWNREFKHKSMVEYFMGKPRRREN